MEKSETLSYFTSNAFLLSLIIAGAAALLLFLVNKAGKTFIRQREALSGNGQRVKGLSKIVLTIVKVLIVFFAVIFILEANNINVTSLIAGLGLTGVVIGFAVQDFLKDIIMGVYITTENYFSIGDVVEYKEGKHCVVKSFTLRSTKLFDADTGDNLTVSNRNITEIRKVSDWLDVLVPAPYDEPAARMRDVCTKIAEKAKDLEHVTDSKFIGTSDFVDSVIYYKIRLFCTPVSKAQTKRDANGIIQDVYAEEGISIPFPQLDVHMKQDKRP